MLVEVQCKLSRHKGKSKTVQGNLLKSKQHNFLYSPEFLYLHLDPHKSENCAIKVVDQYPRQLFFLVKGILKIKLQKMNKSDTCTIQI